MIGRGDIEEPKEAFFRLPKRSVLTNRGHRSCYTTCKAIYLDLKNFVFLIFLREIFVGIENWKFPGKGDLQLMANLFELISRDVSGKQHRRALFGKQILARLIFHWQPCGLRCWSNRSTARKRTSDLNSSSDSEFSRFSSRENVSGGRSKLWNPANQSPENPIESIRGYQTVRRIAECVGHANHGACFKQFEAFEHNKKANQSNWCKNNFNCWRSESRACDAELPSQSFVASHGSASFKLSAN